MDLAVRDTRVRTTLWTEAAANLLVLIAKLATGLATGSHAILADAVHSLADLATNAFALFVARMSSLPPDRDHPYGHRKFETLAVFVLATLLAVLAVELAWRSFDRGATVVSQSGWGLVVMLGVLGVNVAVATWEARRARALDSELLRADAGHTASDVLTTIAVILGWQIAASGYVWLDSVISVFVAALIMVLAFQLFRRSIPVLVDHAAADPESVAASLLQISGVRRAVRVRSRRSADGPHIDVVVGVNPMLSTADSHKIADAIERVIRDEFGAVEVMVHVEPVARPDD